ncbi:helix-turn-helix domain-containing protein [Clostridium pasteurianum]|uniref:Putative transcriptional regulator n=1 Tax=Clostridium pasteurianum BC1 TaxID=86416 RepID=R4KCE2_CLOPA|nr:helix-turn-helix domain-containing protein [Clostridium pasteurianum]AGK98199.1 putative transcriptional regulator [Clostridium pasteurianum BC1]
MNGYNIKKIREEKHITINKLAELAGMSVGYLSDIENNKKKNPTIDKIEKIADALGITIKELLTTEEQLNYTIDTIKNIHNIVKEGLENSSYVVDNKNNLILEPFYDVEFTETERSEIVQYMKYLLSKRKR